MHLSIKCTKIISILTNTHRTFKYPIKWSIENRLLILTSSIYLYLSQSRIPYISAILSQTGYVVIFYFPFQILLGLLFTDKRNAIADIYHCSSRRKTQYCTSILSGNFFLCNFHLALFQNTCFLKRDISFHIQIDLSIICQTLVTTYISFTNADSTVSWINKQFRLFIVTVKLNTI